ncbi:MAG: aspartyl/asparaginyl beta-hydroxylase domain-containing protein [Actinomycetota bacterium]
MTDAPRPGGVAPGVRARAIDVANRLGERVLRGLDGYFGRRSLVGDAAFCAPDRFPWIREVAALAPGIAREADAVLRGVADLPSFQEISTDQYRITRDDRWKTYFLLGYGFRVEDHLARCPETARALARIPGVTTAMFSILAPGKRIPPHGGPYKGVLRYHLGLRVPEPAGACGIRVRGETRHWVEGESLVFDDVWEHSAWNESDGWRVVLFVDFARPLPAPARWCNAAFLRAIAWSPFVQDGKARHRAWEARLEAVRRTRATGEAATPTDPTDPIGRIDGAASEG